MPHSSLELLWVDTVGWDDADLQGKLPLTVDLTAVDEGQCIQLLMDKQIHTLS